MAYVLFDYARLAGGRAIANSPGCLPARPSPLSASTSLPASESPICFPWLPGEGWIESGGNILIFGQSGTGKTHLIAAIGHALIDAGRRVLFSTTTDMVQKLQAARREISLPAMLDKLDKYDLIVLA
ncbi:hypothetical protein X748_27850 [Mesorhizobium sp. LNJC386A00]|nr:hypothetical protein X748_27850 [Mesorhizobium sp. LNJC386A00]